MCWKKQKKLEKTKKVNNKKNTILKKTKTTKVSKTGQGEPWGPGEPLGARSRESPEGSPGWSPGGVLGGPLGIHNAQPLHKHPPKSQGPNDHMFFSISLDEFTMPQLLNKHPPKSQGPNDHMFLKYHSVSSQLPNRYTNVHQSPKAPTTICF